MYDVVLVDDEEIILRGLSGVFPWAKYDCCVAGTASDGREGLALIRRVQPQLLITDIRMPNLDGLSMIAALKSEFPDLQISVLTAFRDFDYARQAIRLGVCRYLLKPSKMDELHEAVAFMTGNLAHSAASSEAAASAEESGEGEAGSFVVRAAMQYMTEHCAEHLSLTDVAEHVYVSQWHLSKLLNRFAKQSFFDLLNSCRVTKAQELLADPAMKVTDVAFTVGYTDVAHFSRSFKKVTGKTPMEYRATLRSISHRG